MAINNMSSGRQHQNIVVQVIKNFENIDVSLPELKKLVRTVCNRFPAFGGSKVTVSIAIVNDAQIRKINKRFLNRNRTSDCLSFDLSDGPQRQSPKLFELIVNGEMAVREAYLRSHSSKAELALYVTHGLLHNVGFDDSTKGKAKKMHDAEDEILQQLGYGSVYNKSVRQFQI
jgi:probable rRNA maturation factor